MQEKLRDVQLKPAVTLDGHRVVLSANIKQAGDAEAVKANGAEGVGLFRTGVSVSSSASTRPAKNSNTSPTRQAAAALKPLPVVIRTLDLPGHPYLWPDYVLLWRVRAWSQGTGQRM